MKLNDGNIVFAQAQYNISDAAWMLMEPNSNLSYF